MFVAHTDVDYSRHESHHIVCSTCAYVEMIKCWLNNGDGTKNVMECNLAVGSWRSVALLLSLSLQIECNLQMNLDGDFLKLALAWTAI